MTYNATLKLSTGVEYRGYGHGHMADTVDKEIVFCTGVVGYMENLTDPAQTGLIVVNTFPLIGNYGVQSDDIQSSSATVAGLVLSHISHNPSNFRSQGELNDFLKSKGIPCISGIDTRSLTHKIRDAGGKLTAKIVFDTPTQQQVAKNLKFELPEYTMGDKPLSVAVIDLGVKNSIKQILQQYGTLHIFDSNAEYNQVMSKCPKAIVLAGGFGNPSNYKLAINLIKANLATKNPIPMFGVGVGHLVLALAHDCKVAKLLTGHRGNQAVRQLSKGRIYQTANNDSYAVNAKNLPDTAKQTYVNINDNSIEGLSYKKTKSMSVAFYPDDIDTVAGTKFVWDEFFSQFAK